MPLTEPYTPVEVTDAQIAFPADALDRMPAWEDIPEAFRRQGHWGHRFWNDAFAHGLEGVSLLPNEHEPELAWRHLLSILRSFAPKHEHKMASLAFLTDLWFRGARWRIPEGEWAEGGEPVPVEHPDG